MSALHSRDMHGHKSPDALKTIREVAEIVELPPHVLRFWETKFPQIQPLKRAGGRRFYRNDDVDALLVIKELLHAKGYTIKGAQAALPRLLKERKDSMRQSLAPSLALISQALQPQEATTAPINAAAPTPGALPPLRSGFSETERKQLLNLREQLAEMQRILRS